MMALKKRLGIIAFFVSNKDRDSSVFTRLKGAIVEASQHLLNQYHPLAYLKIEQHLFDLNKDSITTVQFSEIARDCGFPVNPGTDKFYGALRFFHRKAIVLHFPSIKSMQDVLVLSPQWLIKLFAYVIVAHPFKKYGSAVHDRQYDCLTKFGILHKKFLTTWLNALMNGKSLIVVVFR